MFKARERFGMGRSTTGYVLAIVVFLGAILWQSSAHNGLTAHYYAGTAGNEVPVLQTVEAAISSDRIRNRAARLFDNGPFSRDV